MALIKCEECKAQISDTAKACPQCGAEVSKPTSRLTIFIGGLFAIGVAMAVSNSINAPTVPEKTAAEKQAEAAAEAALGDTAARIGALKAGLKNPASFELVNVTRLADTTLCVSYRGTNSFNAIVTEHKAISPAGRLLDYSDTCNGKSGQNHTHIKRLL